MRWGGMGESPICANNQMFLQKQGGRQKCRFFPTYKDYAYLACFLSFSQTIQSAIAEYRHLDNSLSSLSFVMDGLVFLTHSKMQFISITQPSLEYFSSNHQASKSNLLQILKSSPRDTLLAPAAYVCQN